MADVSSTYTGMSGAGGGNLIRLTGMASGLDVDGTVKKMMAAEQSKLDKAKQDQQVIQWRQEAYQDIIKDIKALQSSFFDISNPTNCLTSQSAYSAFDVTQSDDTVINAVAGIGSKAGNYKVSFTKPTASDEDGKMAAQAIKTGVNISTTNNAITAGNWSGKNIGFSINGAADAVITLDSSGISTQADVVNNINSKINDDVRLRGKVQAVLNSDNRITFQALSENMVKISGDAASTTVTGDMDNLKGKLINPSIASTMGELGLTGNSTISFKYNGSTTSIDVKTTDKISDVINNITSKTSGVVTASFSQLTGQFTIKTSNTGSSQSIQITDSSATDAEKVLGLTQIDGTADTTTASGNDAIAYITAPGNNNPVKVVRSTNNFTVDGINYTLLQQKDSSFTVTNDPKKIRDKISDFLDKYNAIIDKIQTKLKEKKNYDYKPLTDSQKSSMKDSEVTAWNDKAKLGILRNDNNLEELLSNVRLAFTSGLKDSDNNNITSLYFGKNGPGAIGIDTSDTASDGGKITIQDSAMLDNAISKYGNEIYKLFNNVSTTYVGSTSTQADVQKRFNESGIFQRINDILNNNVGRTGATSIYATLSKYANYQDDFTTYGGGSGTNTLPDQIYRQQLLIKKITSDMSTKQERYYQQFSKLETAMNTLNAQQSQLSSMLGG